MTTLQSPTHSLEIQGRFRLYACGQLIMVKENLVTNVGLNHILKVLSGQISAGTFYIALGTNNTLPSPSDTSLYAEDFREQAALVNVSGNQMMVSAFFVAPAINIQEVGVYCGPNASSTRGSGTLLSRSLVNYDNTTNQFDITIDWELTIQRKV